MYFDDPGLVPKIAASSGCTIFVVPEKVKIESPQAFLLAPDEKSVITIDQVRNLTKHLDTKQAAQQFVIIRPADKLGLDAANAFLKNLEEPGENVHYVLVTDTPSKILPTILSRAALYILRQPDKISSELVADEKIKMLAKRLIAAKPADLPALAEEISKKKDGVRNYALSILSTGIEMLYKSYFITKKEVFIQKIPKFLAAYEAIEQNGNVKLHLVSDLL